ncbi:hypothetical protein [Kouleothrix sp.]|uniref:hypothetical protein n=1 Tax=Kouleothrix sp. TaxID=2779161 RepID=UPI00391D9951
MEQPAILRYAGMLRYDTAYGLAALDWRELPGRLEWASFATAEQLARALAGELVADSAVAAFLAGYGLALAAHAWADRPSEARRAAIIQAGEWLRQARPADRRLAGLLEPALAHADAAILAGEDAGHALAQYAGAALSRADRAAERCGRVAAGLLDDGDHLLTCGYAGPALGWLLATKGSGEVRLSVAGTPAQVAPRMTLAVAERLGITARLVPPAAGGEHEGCSVCMVAAAQVALDGSVAAGPGAAELVARARRAGLPCYILSTDGPDPACAGAAQLAGAPADTIAPEQISAIVTHRGIYRPAMIARFLGDGDVPLDVISLHS